MLLAHFPHATPHPDTELDADAAASALLSPLPPTTPPSASFNGFPFSSPGPSAIPDVTQSPAALFMSSFFSPPPVAATPPPADAEGLEIDGYVLGRIIARGGGGVVRSAVPSSTAHSHSSDGEVAVKIVARASLTPLERSRADAEVNLWSGLLHEHILPLFNTYHTPLATYLFMPLCPSGTLLDILRRDGTPGLPTPFASQLWRQVVSGVRYLHEEAKVVHGDLKLENVLLDAQGSARIADFGLSSQIKEGELAPRRQRSVLMARKDGAGGMSRQRSHTNQNMGSALGAHWGGTRERSSAPVVDSNGVETVYELPAGSLPYAAPELLHPPAPGAPYTPAPPQDIWALGVMLYALLAGRLPFADSFEPRLTVKILRGVYDPPPAAAPLIARCLALNASGRWTAAQLDAVAWTADAESSVVESEMARMDAEAQAAFGIEAATIEPDVQSIASPASSSALALDRSRSRARAPLQDVIYEDADEESAPSPSRSLFSSAALSFSPVRSTSSPRNSTFSPPARIASSLSGSSFSSSPSAARDTSLSMSRERGRLPTHARMMHRELSRSPSPSRPPATPIDTLPPSLASVLTASTSGRDVSRGRKARAPELDTTSMERHRPSLERHASHAAELERHGALPPYPRQNSLDAHHAAIEHDLEHDGGRYHSPERRRPRSYQPSPHSYSHAHAIPIPTSFEKNSRRAGSQPPAPWPVSRNGGVTPARRTPGGGFAVGLGLNLGMGGGVGGGRSRSVDARWR